MVSGYMGIIHIVIPNPQIAGHSVSRLIFYKLVLAESPISGTFGLDDYVGTVCRILLNIDDVCQDRLCT